MQKPTTLSLILSVCLLLAILPQESKAQAFEGALVGGATTSQIGGDDLSGFTKWGFFAGPSVSYPLKDKWKLTGQIFYTRKGSKADNDEIAKGKGLWDKLTLTYFEVPVFGEYQLQDRLFLQGGLSPEYLLQAKTRARGELTTDLRRVSLNAVFGGRYELSERLSFMSRLNFSVIPIDKGPISLNTGTNAPNDFRNRAVNLVIKFGLRYAFGD